MSRFSQRRLSKTSAFLPLEERILLAAQPVVAISGQAEAQLGESTSVTLTFDNQPDASPGDRTGFAPYIDLVLPQNGADGSGPGSLPPNQNDGISFAGASFLGQTVHSTVVEFDAAGEATHPLARDSTGALRIVRAADYGAAPGDQLVVLQLPFGSFTPEQTPVSIAVNLTTSPLADVGTPLPITAVGGFAFGRDPLNNPTTDPPILGTPAQFAITPTLLQLSKSFSGADGETATGPNFPRSYLLNLDVATGQTLTNLVFRDQLADGLVITGVSIVAGPEGIVALDPATSDLTVTFGAPLVGIAGTDVTVRVDFYVGEFLAPGQPTTRVLDPGTGAPRLIANELSATADWLPLDPRDPITPVIVDPPGPENVFTARPLAVQKTALVIGGGAPEPGDTVRWTLSAQLSDYFTADRLVMNDRLSDGQLPVPASPILTVREGGQVIYTGGFDAANVTIVRNADGTSDLAFRIADELVLRGISPVLSGGRVGPPTGPATAEVTFDSQVQRFFADGRPLLQGDSIGNTVNVGATPPGTDTQIGDLGSAGLVLDRGQQLEKTVFKINGLDPVGPVPAVTSNDTVTFRLRYLLPTGSTDNFTLTDFLPLPVLLSQGATGPIRFLDIRNDGSDPNTIPPVGTAWFHPDDTFDLANPIGYAGAPTVIVDAAANSVTFDFGDFYMETPQPLQVDILFRLRVEDQPFGDNLFLTNLVTSRESSTPGQVVTDNAIAQINVTQPLLNISKGVVGVATGQTTFPTAFDPTATGPVVFAPPGTAGTPFAGIVNSAALDANPIDSNLANVDAGDLVRFAIVVENTGSGIRGAHDILIQDILPAGYVVPQGGLNLSVTRGDGQVLAFTLEGNGLFDPAGGLRITDPTDSDPDNLEGALTRFTTTSPGLGVPPTAPTGSNLAIIVFDLQVADTAAANGLTLTNVAGIENYAAQDGGRNFAPNLLDAERFDAAAVTTGDLAIDKALIATSLPQSTDPFVFIGEEVTFRVVATIREGTTQDLVLVDLLPTMPGVLSLLDWRITNLGTNISFTGAPPPVGTPQTGAVTINLGDVTNLADNLVDARDTIVFEVRARIDDLPQNNGGDVLVNTATATFTDATGATRHLSDTDSVTIAEPAPELTKTADRATADGGDVVTYTVVVRNPVTGGTAAPLFDLDIRDLLDDPDLALVAGSVALAGSGAANASIVLGNGTADTAIRVTSTQLDPGAELRITYQARVGDTVQAGRVVPNTATLQGDSAPGTVPGERNYQDLDTENVSIIAPQLAKTVIATSPPETGNSQGDPNRPDLAFGEEVTFRLDARFGEGTTANAMIADLLPIGPAPLQLLSARIVSVGGSLSAPGAVVGNTGVAGDRNGDGFNDNVAFALGTLVNMPDGIANAGDVITIEVVARLRGDAGATGGLVLTNQGELNFTSQDQPRSVTAQAAVETVLPRLAIDKSPDRATADGGDVITYTVRLTNQSGAFAAPAFDLAVADLITDPNLRLVAGSVTAAGVPATIVDGNDPGDTQIRITLDALAVGQVLTITYQARVADFAPAGARLDNTASYAGDTYPGVQPGEAPLSGSDDARVLIGTPELAKEVIATSLPETGSGAFNPNRPDAAIGETVTYRVTLTVREGSSIDLRLVDQLPAGDGVMEFLAYRIVPLPGTTNLDFVPGTETALATDTNGDGRLDRIELGFGTVINTPDNVSDGDDQILVEVTGRVIDAPANTAGRVLTNSAQTFLGTTALDQVSASVDVVEPLLQIIKDADLSAGDAGDTITYRLTVSNLAAATGPAYDLQLTDLLPAGMRLVAGSVTTDRGTVAQGNAPGDTAIRVDLTGIALLPRDNPLTPGLDDTRVVVTYQARLEDTVEPGQALTNEARFSGVTAPPGLAGPDARPLAGTTSDTVRVTMPVQLDKAIVATSNPGTAGSSLAVGETVTYRLTATLSEGTQTLVIRDLLPAGLEFVAGRVAAVGAGLPPGLLATQVTANGQQVVANFGTVVNTGNNIASDGTVAIEITARVADVPGNQPGTVLTNAGSATVTSPTNPGAPGGTLTDTAGTTAEIVGPALVLDKVAPTGFARPGEVITYTLTLRHAPNSTSAAYDLTIADALTDANLVLVGGSVQASAGTVVIGNGAADRAISVTLDELALGQVVTVTFRATVAAGAPGGATLQNTATTDFDSNPGPGGRPGTIGDTAEVPLAPGFVKQLAGTSLPQTTGGDFAIGEVVTYRVTTTVPLGALVGLTVSDLLPEGLTPQSATVISVGSGITGAALAPGAAGIISGQSIRFAFGDVVNGSPPAIDAADRIVVEITARVADVAGNQAGTPLTNDAQLSYTIGGEPGTDGSSVSGSVVTPALDIGKTVDRLTGDAGDVFTYTVTITPGGTGPAYDVVVVDTLDGVLLPIGVSTSFGTASFNGQVIRLEIPVLLPTHAPVVLTYQVRFADTVEPGRVVGNVAGLDFSTAPGGPGGGGRPGEESANGPDLTAVFDLDLTKAIIATSIPETRAGFFDPALPDIAIGEVVTYELVTTLSEGTQRVVLRDVIPEGLAFVPGTFTVSTGGSISAGAGGTLAPTPALAGRTASLDFGRLVNAGDNVSDAGDRITVRFQAIALDDPANNAGRLLRNDADVTASAITAPSVPGGTLTDAAFADAEIVTAMLALEKAVVPIAGDAGDVFTYTLTLDHLAGPASTAPAFLVLVVDSLPGTLILDAGSITTSLGHATAVGNTVQIEIPVLLPGDPPVTVTYQARLADGIEPGQVVPNTASVTYVSAPGAVSRPGFDDASASINGVGAVTLTKAIVATSLPGTGANFFDPNRPDLAIGEVVTYRLVATISEGTARLVIADLLPAGLVPETALVTLVGVGLPAGLAGIAGVINGQAVTFDFGTIVNTGNNLPADNSITVEVTARVADVAGNQAGTLLVNGAVATLTSPTNPGAPGGTLTSGDSTGADVVTPVLVIDKAADRAFATLGETITYTLVLTHAPGSTAPAYNVELSDPLTGGALRLVAGSVSTSLGTVTSGNGGADTAVRVSVAELDVGQSVTVTFRATATAVPPPDGNAPNIGTFKAASAPGGPPGFVRAFTGSDDAVVRISSAFTGGGTAGLASEIDDFLARERAILAQPLTITPIYSGTAQPGTAITLAARDGSGEIVGQETRLADTGGNWLVPLPAVGTTRVAPDNTGTLQASIPIMRDRDLGLNAGLPEVSRPDVPNANAGGGLVVTPAQTAPLSASATQGPDSTRIYFAGPLGPTTFGNGPADALSGARALGVSAVAPDIAGMSRPYGLALNKFALDFLAGSTVPSGRLN